MMETRNIVLVGSLSIILLITLGTFYEINKTHKEKLFNAMSKKVTEAALTCYNEEKCLSETIYLSELYELEYLSELINPLNNEYLEENSYVQIKSLNNAELIIVD